MNIHISAEPVGRNLAVYIARLFGPIAIWVGLSLWQHYSFLVVLGVAVPLAALSFMAVVGRGSWDQVEIARDTITLVGGKRTAVIKREHIIKLDIREQAIAVKWRGEPKDEIAVLGKERFSSESWAQLSQGLQPWAA